MPFSFFVYFFNLSPPGGLLNVAFPFLCLAVDVANVDVDIVVVVVVVAVFFQCISCLSLSSVNVFRKQHLCDNLIILILRVRKSS